jgi:hypothetical protein
MRRSTTVPGLCILLLSLIPGVLSAQLCVGNPELGVNSSGNAGLGVSFFDGGKGYGGSLTFGRSVFGFGSFSYLDIDDTTLSFKTVSGGVGYAAPATAGSVSLCPSVTVGYGFGLEIIGIDVTTVTITPALSAGILSEVTPTFAVAPFAQIGFVYTRASADAGPLGEDSESDTSGVLVLGAGFLFNSRLSIGPSVAIPIAEDGGDTSFRIGLAIALGDAG